MARLYRKRPIVVEVVEVSADDLTEAVEFLRHHQIFYIIRSAGLVIRTQEGDMLAEPGDYIIRGANGSCYPCKPDDFVASYEPINGPSHR